MVETKVYKYKRIVKSKDGSEKEYVCSQRQEYKGNDKAGRPLKSFTLKELHDIKKFSLKIKKILRKQQMKQIYHITYLVNFYVNKYYLKLYYS